MEMEVISINSFMLKTWKKVKIKHYVKEMKLKAKKGIHFAVRDQDGFQ